MKLIDILVRELPRKGGWPGAVPVLVQNSSGCVYQAGGGRYIYSLELAEDWMDSEVTCENYFAALRSQKPEPVWDGEGLPPVGSTVTCVSPGYPHESFNRFIGNDVVIVAHDHVDSVDVAVFRMQTDDRGEEYAYHSLTANCFRQIRSEADKKRRSIIEAIEKAYKDCPHSEAVPEAIYDAIVTGCLPGVNIE
ncbi:TPA: hypothetical protein SHX75_003417 [Escherichia coli]|nr:hypothetical protein [Escherichia coli]